MARPGLTLIELAVVLCIIAALIAILLPALGAARRNARSMQNSTQHRGIHRALLMYAQGNGGFFTGLKSDGSDADTRVEARFEPLLRGNYFTGEYAVSPSEARTAWTTGPVLPSHYSYAMLQLPAAGHRRAEWRETLNAQAPALGDRNAGSANDVYSVHTGPGQGWRGSVVYNDNHTVFESTHVHETGFNPPRDAPAGTPPARHPADDLFVPAGDDDALWVHSGN